MELSNILSILGVFFSGAGLAIAVIKFGIRGYFNDVLNQLTNCKKEYERIDRERKECRTHCEERRLQCSISRENIINRLYDKIEKI